MSDIGLFSNDGEYFDVLIVEDDLAIDEGLETAVIISLFSDRRITEEQLPDLETSKRGWWGDVFPDVDLDKIGSRLWTIEREKRTIETLRRSEELCKEALKWMKEDGIADEIIINSEYNEEKNLIINISITQPDDQTQRFAVFWEKQELRRL